MLEGSLSDAALVLVAHGSTLNAESAAPAFQHVDELQRRGIFAQVLPAFWKQEPFVWSVLRGTYAPRVFVMPLFISHGYFTDEVIPREIGLRPPNATRFSRVQRRGNQMIYYCQPVGTHDSMVEVLLARAREAMAGPGGNPVPSDTALVVVGHGTGRNENSRASIEHVVALIQSRQIYRETRSAFIEEAPRVADWHRVTSAPNVVVVPFFISDGLHSYEDIPVLLGESAAAVRQRFMRGEPTWLNPTELHGRRVWYARAVGTEPRIADVILERVGEAAGWPLGS